MTGELTNFLNRELSWLEFNQRVLDEACDATVPLLDRVRFIAITSSNLDEFFMVRVGGLQILEDRGSTKRDPAGMTPQEQLVAISRRTHKLVADQYECWVSDLLPALGTAGLQQVKIEELTSTQSKYLNRFFADEVFSILAPLAVESQLPLLANRSVNLCVRLERDCVA